MAPSGSSPCSSKPDDPRDQHRHRLAQHRRLGLDPADAPAEHTESVDHRRVRVGADERVRVQPRQLAWVRAVRILLEHDPRQVLEVDLVDDPRVRRDDRELVERPLPPAQKGVALLVALELALGVEAEGVARAERVDLHRVVDHELGRRQRVDLRGIAPHLCDRVAHRRQVDDRGHAGEVLHQHARGRERDLLARLRLRIPARERLDVLPGDGAVALGAQQVLEQHLQRERQPRDVKALLQRVQPEDLVLLAAYLECALRAKAVV